MTIRFTTALSAAALVAGLAFAPVAIAQTMNKDQGMTKPAAGDKMKKDEMAKDGMKKPDAMSKDGMADKKKDGMSDSMKK